MAGQSVKLEELIEKNSLKNYTPDIDVKDIQYPKLIDQVLDLLAILNIFLQKEFR